MKATYQGSCHCGNVQFEADIDFNNGTSKCNCSICARARSWAAIIAPDAFRLIDGEASLSDYQFGNKTVHHYFCKTCGIRPFEKGFHESVGGHFYCVQISCLDDAGLDDVLSGPLRYADGRNDNWSETPSEVRHL